MQLKMLPTILFLAMYCVAVVIAIGTRSLVSDQYLQAVAGSLEMYVDPLPQMPKIYGYSMSNGQPSSVKLTMGMFQKKWKFHRDLPPTTVFVYGTDPVTATFPGPTIEALQGVPLWVTWQNYLPAHHILPWDPTIPVAIPSHGGVPTVVHLHGGVNPPQSDGSAFAWFTAGFRDVGPKWTQATYMYPNIQCPGNLWYHDHALGLTRANLLAGLIGAYVIRNATVEAPFGLPSGDLFELHLVIADRSFYKDGSLYMNYTGDNPTIHPEWQPEYFGEAITVNGKAWPFLVVLRCRYRFRILNSSNARYFNLSLSNNLPFTVIGSDSTYLHKPIETLTILIAPSEIFDLVIDFTNSPTQFAEMMNSAAYPYPSGDAPNNLNGRVMKFVVAGNLPMPDESRVPPTLVKYVDSNVEEAVKHRYIVLYEYESPTDDPTHLYINGLRFQDPATEKPKPGTTEVWDVINLTEDNHPLHLHLATFNAKKVTQIQDLDTFKDCMTVLNDAEKCNVTRHAEGPTVPVPDYEKTWKNVVKMTPGYMTTIVVKFRLVHDNGSYPFDVTAEPGYVYHCHILDHEDNEMIRPLKLTYT
ncbi:hypothetical protein LUZ63_016277 [Rhynchospora breviuscula]|uniref:Uncharacterized protein n=1 Tax=Rhynchospora breviuscula TaxID=2022672 RepID=A0A9Q0C167_9POAL|nr:hypothetical protein LUZ63_016277 [Rhynchospora breviuscula]